MSASQQEIINTITLTRLNYFSLAGILELYRRAGSATTILENKENIRDILPDASDKLVETLKNCDEARRRAEVEMEYDLKYGIMPLCMNDERYPQRLKECDDAPLMLFYKGTADLNQKRVINIVGTRRCTLYGEDIIRRFIADLKRLCPQVLVVSGLAYGVDIHAHQQALCNGYETVGVLAHGLDNLYPSSHRAVAAKMINQGGLLTEFLTQTNADKINFVRRNRIVAGMSAATLLVESAEHGGGLVTCRLAQSYQHDVFAFPGNINNPYSVGCNRLIRDNMAGLVTSAEDILKAMAWEEDIKETVATNGASSMGSSVLGATSASTAKVPNGAQSVLDVLTKENDLHIDIIATRAGLPVNKVLALLFQLEMSGMVSSLSGGRYHKVNS